MSIERLLLRMRRPVLGVWVCALVGGMTACMNPSSPPAKKPASTKADNKKTTPAAAKKVAVPQAATNSAPLAADSSETLALVGSVAKAHVKRGNELVTQKNYKAALEFYRMATVYQPQNAALTLAQHRLIAFIIAADPNALSADSMGQVSLVLLGLEKTDVSNQHVYRTAQANLMARVGQLEQAVVKLKGVLEKKPNYLPAIESLGMVLMVSDKTDAAINRFKSALKLNADSARSHAALGQLLFKTGDQAGALDHARKAVKAASTAPNHVLLGDLLRKNGETQKALKQYHRAASLDQASAIAFGRLGSILLDKGDDTKARAALTRSFQLKRDGDVLYRLAVAEAKLGQYDTALQYLFRLAKDSPNTSSVFTRIGEIQEKRGRSAEALLAYRRALQLIKKATPRNAKAIEELSARVQKLEAGLLANKTKKTPGPAFKLKNPALTKKRKAPTKKK